MSCPKGYNDPPIGSSKRHGPDSLDRKKTLDANNTYELGEELRVRVRWSNRVVMTGAPQLGIQIDTSLQPSERHMGLLGRINFR